MKNPASIWMVETRRRVRKNGKWCPWDAQYGNTAYLEYPTKEVRQDTYCEKRAVEYIRKEEE
jgi:hypothetical protein